MLTDRERDALRQWYTQAEVLEQARRLTAHGELEELEEYLQMTCLFPISRHSELPAFMLDDEGKPLFPSNLNPKKDLERWRDAIEIAWEVVEERLGLAHDDVHRQVAKEQATDWEAFMESVERRKRERS